MEEFIAKQADKALKNKVLSSGSEVFLTAKLATDGVDFLRFRPAVSRSFEYCF